MKTSFISAYNLEALAQTNGTHEITVNTSKEFYALHDYLVFTLGWDCYEYAHVSQDGSVTINIRVNNNQPEPTNPDNTPTTMNANEIRYNYIEAVTADVLDYINENNITVTNETRDEVEQQLNDDLWACDSVTGNASGSYTFNAWQAEENICHNWDLLAEACDEFGSDAAELLRKGAEACDVTIRCYLLGQAISAALDEVETEEDTEE